MSLALGIQMARGDDPHQSLTAVFAKNRMDTIALVPEECAVDHCNVSIGEDNFVHVQLVTLETFDTEPLKVRSADVKPLEQEPWASIFILTFTNFTTVSLLFLTYTFTVADN